MDAERFQRLRQVFEQASELPAHEREGYLTEACGADTTLRLHVDRMLQADTEFLEHEVDPVEALRSEPEEIGGYRIVRRLGEGGMGIVYLAQQADPERFVALKVLRWSGGSRELAWRFRYEIEVLARLNHPCIARIYESGLHTTPSGEQMPFFVMEFVEDAQDLTRWCLGRSMKERLTAFQATCDAVQYGHAQGIIHRDLKPQNVLVDGSGRPKVIDFGVARPRDSERSQATRTGEIVGTLSRMSPEQLQHDPGRVDTRTDVYALGFMLYELLCGTTPYLLEDKPITEVARIIQEVAPIDPQRVAPQAPRELGWIALRALEKEPERRYASVSELGADIQRYLANEPVQAGPPSAWYRWSKFVRRNRLPVSLAGGALLAVIAGGTAASVGFVRASTEADKYSRIHDLMDGMLVSVRSENLGRDVRVADLLDRAATDMQENLQGQPEIEFEMRMTLANSYAALGLFSEAGVQSERALALSRELGLQGEPEYSQAVLRHATSLQRLGRLDEAMALVEAEESAALRGASAEVLADLRAVRGRIWVFRDQADRALKDFEAWRADASQSLPEDHPALASLDSVRIEALRQLERFPTALQHAEELQARFAERPGSDLYLDACSRVAALLILSNRTSDAVQAYESLVLKAREVHGGLHPIPLNATAGLGRAYAKAKRMTEAKQLLAAALEGWEELLGPEHRESISVRNSLASVEAQSGDASAIADMQIAFETNERMLGANDPRTIVALESWAKALTAERRTEEAAPLLERAREAWIERHGPDSERALATRHSLGFLYYQQRRMDEALVELRLAWEGLRELLGPRDEQVLHVASNYMVVLTLTGKYEAALPIAKEVLAVQLELLDPGHPTLLTLMMNVAEVHTRLGDLASAQEAWARAARHADEQLVDDHPMRLRSQQRWAEALLRRGQNDAAGTILEALLPLAEGQPALAIRDRIGVQESYGDWLRTCGEHERALTFYEMAFETYPAATRPDDSGRVALIHKVIEALRQVEQEERIEEWNRRLPAEKP